MRCKVDVALSSRSFRQQSSEDSSCRSVKRKRSKVSTRLLCNRYLKIYLTILSEVFQRKLIPHETKSALSCARHLEILNHRFSSKPKHNGSYTSLLDGRIATVINAMIPHQMVSAKASYHLP